MIAVDSSVLIELLVGSDHADAAETALREALALGPVVVCDVVVAEVCSSLRDGDQAMQVLGGNGYLKDYATERYYRDARQLMLVEGTSEIHRLIIARALDDGLLDWGYDVEAAGGVPGKR